MQFNSPAISQNKNKHLQILQYECFMNTHKMHLDENLDAKLQKVFQSIVPLVSNDRFNQLVTNFSTQIERDLQHHLVFTTFRDHLYIT